MNLEPPGLTLSQFTESNEGRPSELRAAYGAMMRHEKGLQLPSPTRIREDEGAIKFCLPVSGDDGIIRETESVIVQMNGYRGNNWHTLCVSSQVGCKLACTFCETGRMGLHANLSASQIVAQRIAARRFVINPQNTSSWRYDSDGIRNIVFMGMGEPFDNFDAVVQSIRVLSDPAGLNIPHSRITISTAGRIDGIRRLAELKWPRIRLAVSLNAANDTLRNTLMPVNRAMPLVELKRALLDYPLEPNGRFLIEYVLMRGVNDSLSDADETAAWCRDLPCTVNLIPYNAQSSATFEPPGDAAVLAFMNHLKWHGLFVKRRITHGQDLMGACGQLGNPEARRLKKESTTAGSAA